LEQLVKLRTDLEIADTVAAMAAAHDPKTCTRLFQRTIATFDVDSFACGEVDLAVLEQTVFYAIGWPETWRKFYVGSRLVRRDPLLDALNGIIRPSLGRNCDGIGNYRLWAARRYGFCPITAGPRDRRCRFRAAVTASGWSAPRASVYLSTRRRNRFWQCFHTVFMNGFEISLRSTDLRSSS